MIERNEYNVIQDTKG